MSVPLEKQDYSVLIELLKEVVDIRKVRVVAYRLMLNHFIFAVDGSENVYVTGYSSDVGKDYDYDTIKYIQEKPSPHAVPTMTLWGGIVMAGVLGLLMSYMVRKKQTAS